MLDHLSCELAHLSSVLAHLSPQLAHLSPQLAYLSPQLAYLIPKLAHLSPKLVHLNPKLAHFSPMIPRAPIWAHSGPLEIQVDPKGPKICLFELKVGPFEPQILVQISLRWAPSWPI